MRAIHIIGTLGAISTLAFMVACGKSSNSNNTATTNFAAPLNTTCPAGTTPYNSGGINYCIDAYGNIVNGFYNTNLNSSYGSDNYALRNLTVSNSTGMKEFLKKAMGVCDRTHSTGGVYDCGSWVSGYVKILLSGVGTNSMIASFYAYPTTNQYYWYGYQLPSLSQFFAGMFGFPVFSGYAGIMRNPLPLNLTVSAINNSQGFEGRAYGDLYTQANRSLIQVQVATGKAGDASFNYQIGFEGSVIMNGTFVNCQTGYCSY